MEPPGQEAEVTPGAVLAALTILDATEHDEEHLAARADEVVELLQVWGITAITRTAG